MTVLVRNSANPLHVLRDRYRYIVMTLDQDFDAAAAAVQNLTKRPTDGELLELYALFKQASLGDVNTAKPGMLDPKGRAKWNEWDGKKGMSRDAAKRAYVSCANALVAKYK